MALQFGNVTGRFVAVAADSTTDEDLDPDVIPLQGTVTFTPRVSAILVAEGSPTPFTALPAPIRVRLDEDGYLAHNGSRGVRLLATNGSSNPSNFTYQVSFSLSFGNLTTPYPNFDVKVSANGTIDLTTVAPVPSSPGVPITRGTGVESVVAEDGQFVFRLTDGSEERVAIPASGDGGASLPVGISDVTGLTEALGDKADKTSINGLATKASVDAKEDAAWYGTQAEFDALPTKDANKTYNILG